MAVCWLSARTCSLLPWSFQEADLKVSGEESAFNEVAESLDLNRQGTVRE